MSSWSECSSKVDYSRADLLAPVIPLYQQFFAENKISILVYSGDVDGVVPHTGKISNMHTFKQFASAICNFVTSHVCLIMLG